MPIPFQKLSHLFLAVFTELSKYKQLPLSASLCKSNLCLRFDPKQNSQHQDPENSERTEQGNLKEVSSSP